MLDSLILVVNSGTSHDEDVAMARKIMTEFYAMTEAEREATGFREIYQAETIGMVVERIWKTMGPITVLLLAGSFLHQAQIAAEINPPRVRAVLMRKDIVAVRSFEKVMMIPIPGPSDHIPFSSFRRPEP